MKKYLTIKEAAELLGVTPLTLRNWDRAGKLSASRNPINNYRVYRKEDIDGLLGEIEFSTRESVVGRAPSRKEKSLPALPVPERPREEGRPSVDAVWLAGVFALVLIGGLGAVVMRRGRSFADEFTIAEKNDNA